MIVYLLWMNDKVLGVYPSSTSANKALLDYKKRTPRGDWHRFEFGHWYQRNGPIARLKVESRKVFK